jgi:hypothetical protein
VPQPTDGEEEIDPVAWLDSVNRADMGNEGPPEPATPQGRPTPLIPDAPVATKPLTPTFRALDPATGNYREFGDEDSRDRFQLGNAALRLRRDAAELEALVATGKASPEDAARLGGIQAQIQMTDQSLGEVVGRQKAAAATATPIAPRPAPDAMGELGQANAGVNATPEERAAFEAQRRAQAANAQMGQLGTPRAPAAAPASPQARLLAYVTDTGKSLNPEAVARDLGVTVDVANGLLSKLTAQENSPVEIRQGKSGSKIQRKARLKGPMNLFQDIADLGGIPNVPELAQMDLPKMVGGGAFGALVRPNGRDPALLAEDLQQRGYFGDATREGRKAGANDLYNLIDEHARNKDVYSDNDVGEVLVRDTAAAEERAADELGWRYGTGAEGATRFGAAQMQAAGLLGPEVNPETDSVQDIDDAIDERLSIMGVKDIEAALASVDASLGAVAPIAEEGTFDGDFSLGSVEEGPAPAERPAASVQESESVPGRQREGESSGRVPVEAEQAQRPTGEDGEAGRLSRIRDIADRADETLSGEAERALDAFVGHPRGAKNAVTDEWGIGAFSTDRVESAVNGDNPKLGAEIEEAFAPVRDELRDVVGDTITLYRYPGKPIPPGTAPRSTLSWTADRRFADLLAGVRRNGKRFSEGDIARMERELEDTGRTDVSKTEYLEKTTFQTPPSGSFEGADGSQVPVIDIYDSDGYVTDADSVRSHLESINAEVDEIAADNAAKKQQVLVKRVSLDDVVWVTDRAGQAEFIVRETAATPAAPQKTERLSPDEGAVDRVTPMRDAPEQMIDLSLDEIDQAREEIKSRDFEDVVLALGSEQKAREYLSLDRRRNSSNPVSAEKASVEIAKIEDNLTPWQASLIFGTQEDKRLTPEGIDTIRDAAADVEFLSDAEKNKYDVARVFTWGMSAVKRGGIEAIKNGTADAETQAGFMRMRGAFNELKRRGLSKQEIDEVLIETLVARGVTDPNDAVFLLDEALAAFGGKRGATKPSSEQVAEPQQRLQAPPTAPPRESERLSPDEGATQMDVKGVDVTITTPKGEEQRGPVGANGQPGKINVNDYAHHGYVTRENGERVDAYVGSSTGVDRVFVIDQTDPATGNPGTPTAILGAWNLDRAVRMYQGGLNDGLVAPGPEDITQMSMDEFKAWLRDGGTATAADTTSPADETGDDIGDLSDETALARSSGPGTGLNQTDQVAPIEKMSFQELLVAAEAMGYDEVGEGTRVFGDIGDMLVSQIGMAGAQSTDKTLSELGISGERRKHLQNAYERGQRAALSRKPRPQGPRLVQATADLEEAAVELYRDGNRSGFSEEFSGPNAQTLQSIVEVLSRRRADTPSSVMRYLRTKAGVDDGPPPATWDDAANQGWGREKLGQEKNEAGETIVISNIIAPDGKVFEARANQLNNAGEYDIGDLFQRSYEDALPKITEAFGDRRSIAAPRKQIAPTETAPPRSGGPGTKLTSGIDPTDALRMIRETTADIGKLLSKVSTLQIFSEARKTPKATPDQNPVMRLGSLNNLYRFSSSLASRFPKWARYSNLVMDRHAHESELIRSAEPLLRPVLDMSKDRQTAINKILEWDRLTGNNRRRTSKRLVAVLRDEPTARKRDLSKPGETVELTEAETDAFFKVREFLDTRWVQRSESASRYFGYQGAWNLAAIDAALNDTKGSTDKGTIKAVETAKALWEMQEDARRRGYVPFMRYGDHVIRIKPKPVDVPGKDATPTSYEDGGVFFVETEKPMEKLLDRKYKGKRALAEKRAELAKKFPKDKYDWEEGSVVKLIDKLDIPAIEKVFAAINSKNPKLGEKFYQEIMTEFYDEVRSGIYKESRNIPGYDPDFMRALGDYNRISASNISNMLYGRDVETAFEDVIATSDQNLIDFAEKYRAYVDSPKGDLSQLRQAGFFAQLWGSASSATVQISQIPFVTVPQLAAWAGATRASSLALGTLAKVGRPRSQGGAVYFDKKTGMEIDWDAVTSDPELAPLIKKYADRGDLSATLTQDLYGQDASRYSALKGAKPMFERVFNIGASAFNTGEKLNRVVTFIAYYKAAKDPAAMAKFKKMYGKDNRVLDMARTAGRTEVKRLGRLEQTAEVKAEINKIQRELAAGTYMTPEVVALFGVQDTQFIPGKFDRPELLRGWGGVIFQFKQYPANYMRLLIKNLTMQGREGKVAAAYMIGMMATFSGVMGLPFAGDILWLVEKMWEWLGEDDPQFEKEFREAIGTDNDIQKFAAEAILHGLGRVTPADISRRVGQGELLPSADPWMAIPVVAGTVGRWIEARDRFATGQDYGGVVALLSPIIGKGPADAMRGLLQLPMEGYVTKSGKTVIPKEDVTIAQKVLKALGWQPSKFSKTLEADWAAQRAANAGREQRSNLLKTLGRLGASQRRATTPEEKQRYKEKFNRVIADAKKNGIPLPTADSIRGAIGSDLDPKRKQVMSAPKDRRGDVMDAQKAFPGGRE